MSSLDSKTVKFEAEHSSVITAATLTLSPQDNSLPTEIIYANSSMYSVVLLHKHTKFNKEGNKKKRSTLIEKGKQKRKRKCMQRQGIKRN